MGKEVLGSIYCKTSEDFMRGLYLIAGAVKAEQHDLAVVEMKERRLGNIYGFDGGNYAGNVYDNEMLSPTIRTYQGGNQQSMIVAMRGRNPDNPSGRTAGSPTVQRLEPNSQGICNTLTSVQKDNMVLEPKLVGGIGEKWGDKQYRQGNSDSAAMALTSQPLGNTGGILICIW